MKDKLEGAFWTPVVWVVIGVFGAIGLGFKISTYIRNRARN